ncbi:hypothetical protein QBC47DRAFT_60162 [Echria macrotheca]|uniref:Secreted protein n=1 Tax=Echria macrotheca TaxID=438768 RepID=A0AAJ0F6M7_9PEZI|nr:hypothetical protein QBC47DRAFT_60162 [Echria macrotheca]
MAIDLHVSCQWWKALVLHLLPRAHATSELRLGSPQRVNGVVVVNCRGRRNAAHRTQSAVRTMLCADDHVPMGCHRLIWALSWSLRGTLHLCRSLNPAFLFSCCSPHASTLRGRRWRWHGDHLQAHWWRTTSLACPSLGAARTDVTAVAVTYPGTSLRLHV